MADRLRLLLFFCVLLCSLPLSAHKLKVFAMAEGETIQGQAYFVGGSGASGAEIRINDADGNQLACLKPDAEGRFEYRIESAMDYEVVVDTLDGHRASWSLKAAEFSPAVGAMTDKPVGSSQEQPGYSASEPVVTEERRDTEAQCGQIASRQRDSLRDALRACEERQRLRDILGGLGYIAGLAGLGLWWSSRRPRHPQ
jgi:nickel transport protein